MADRKKLRHRIAEIRANHPHHWKNAVWAWGNRGDDKGRKLRRFLAYRSYAEHQEQWLRDHKDAKDRRDRIEELNAAEKGATEKIEHLRKLLKPDPKPPPASGCRGWYDGHPVPTWMIPYLQRIRARGHWHGVVVSGVRTPEQSRQLCRNMCGHDTCPGKCAGIYSNHNCTACCFPDGAIDVSDYIVFAAEARAVGAPFHNGLPATDPVHFSNPGN